LNVLKSVNSQIRRSINLMIFRLPASHEVDDFHCVALVDHDLGKPLTLEDGEIVLDGNAARIDVELCQQVSHADRMVELETFTIQGNLHLTCGTRSKRTALK